MGAGPVFRLVAHGSRLLALAGTFSDKQRIVRPTQKRDHCIER